MIIVGQNSVNLVESSCSLNFEIGMGNLFPVSLQYQLDLFGIVGKACDSEFAEISFDLNIVVLHPLFNFILHSRSKSLHNNCLFRCLDAWHNNLFSFSAREQSFGQGAFCLLHFVNPVN